MHNSHQNKMYNPTQNKTARASAQAMEYALQTLPVKYALRTTQDALQALQGTQDALQGTQDALQGTQDALQGTQDALQATQDALQATRDALQALQAIRDSRQAIRDSRQARRDARQVTRDANQATGNVHKATQDALQALQTTQDALQALQTAQDALQTTQDAPQTTQDALQVLQARRDALEATRDARQATRDARQATRDALQARRDALQATRDALQALQATRDARQATRDALQALQAKKHALWSRLDVSQALQATQDALQALQAKKHALRSRLDVRQALQARRDALGARRDALGARRDALRARRDALQTRRGAFPAWKLELNRRKWSKQQNTGWFVPVRPVLTSTTKTDQYDVHNPTTEITATNEKVNNKQTQTETAGLLTDTCAPFLDESAGGSSSPNSESEEIIKHNNMDSKTMLDDDYTLQGKSVPLSAYPHFMFSSNFSGPWRTSCLLPCSHSMVSLSKIPRANNNFTQVNSSLDMLLKEFTPVITDDFDDETCLFQCSCPGLYQCSVTGLVFLMQGEGDVVYRTVPWNRRLLAQHHKKPAGPLFDITCQQQSVCQLCLPHCEVISTGGGQFLQVAHVNDEGIEFITPHQITETHIVINITGFSGYGNVKDEDSPPDPVQALVLLFYKPPVDPDFRSILSVLLLPRNIVIRDVQRTRRKLNGDERYVDTSPHCKLHPKQVYTLSTVPEDDLIKVQPKEADFDDEYHDSYFTSFQVILRRILTDVNLSLKAKSSSTCVWERDVCLFSPTVGTLNGPSSQRLLNTRSCFIEGISGPVLSSLIDKLLEKTVITDAEREEADAMQNKREKARFVIDTVRSKGQAASSELINFLRENDHILCQHLGLN